MDAPGRVSAAPAPGGPPRLGPYRLLRGIGEGGMGVVHLAVAPDGTRVALKVLRPHVVADAAGRERLAREVDALQRVRSSRVAALLDADAWGPTPYVVTRFVPGLSLPEYVAEYGAMSGAGLLRLGHGLADALAAVHAVGVVHRDVKPSNVLLEGEDPVLIDFGLARAADDATVTVVGGMLGTPAYLSPELAEGHDPVPAGDVHAWASTIAFACTGRSPFGTGHQAVVIDRVRRNAYDLTGVPPDMRAVLERCLVADPRARPPAAVLAGWLGGLGGGRAPDRTTVRVPAAPVEPQVAEQPPGTRAFVGPQPAPAWDRPARPLARRVQRVLVAALGIMICAAAFAAAPYAAVIVSWLLTGTVLTWRRIGDARRRRRLLRGRQGASDDVVMAASSPWHVAVALLRSALHVGGALLAAAVAGGLVNLFGVGLGQGLWVTAGIFLAVLWLGPGGEGLHRPAVVLVDTLARPDLVGLALLWVLAALAAGSVAVVEGVDTAWWPDSGPPL